MTAGDRIVIIGAGVAGVSAAEGAREAGHQGEIVIIGNEDDFPYMRGSLTDDIMSGIAPGKTPLRPERWYDQHRIDLVTGTDVGRVDPRACVVATTYGDAIRYDRLIIATGLRARRLSGVPALNVRTAVDARRMLAALSPARRVVVIGAGTTGTEIAAGARARGCQVTLLVLGDRPLARHTPTAIGEAWARLHRDNGVTVETGVEIAGASTTPEGVLVQATDGREWLADVLASDLGARPNQELAERAGVTVDDGILVDEYGRTSVPGILAAGDVAKRHIPVLQQHFRAATWRAADSHGRAVGHTAAGDPAIDLSVPEWQSTQFGVTLSCAGFPGAGDETTTHQGPGGSIVVLSRRGEHLLGVATVGPPEHLDWAAHLISRQIPVDSSTVLVRLGVQEVLRS